MTGRAQVIGAALAAVLVVAGACSSSGDDAASGDEAAAGGAAPTTELAAAACEPDVPATVDSVPVAGSAVDVDVVSFDGATIRAHWFPVEGAAGPSPTVLMGPGWSLPGDTDVNAVGVLGAVSIRTLRESGYNVLTWDPRGFHSSGGTVQVDSPDFEGRDVQYLLSWVAGRPEAQLDEAGDPAVGMVGGSYGGGIQLVTASIDCRVDAIVPIVAWHSLLTSLYKADTFKEGWATVLVGAPRNARLDPMVTSAFQQGKATGVLSAEQEDWFGARGPGESVADITAPTLLVGGTVDNLFTLAEAVENYDAIGDGSTPVAMVWMCGGHGVCLTEKGDEARIGARILAWLDRYVAGDESVDPGPRFELLDQTGARFSADGYPGDVGTPIEASGSGTLELRSDGGSGPAVIPAAKKDVLAGLAGDVTPWPASNSVDVVIPVSVDTMVLGAPELIIEYAGTSPTGAEGTAGRPTRVFAQIVDDETGLVVGNQVTPVPLELDGTPQSLRIPLEVIAHTVSPDSRLRLQIVATTTLYGLPRLGGTVEFSQIDIALPTSTGLEPIG